MWREKLRDTLGQLQPSQIKIKTLGKHVRWYLQRQNLCLCFNKNGNLWNLDGSCIVKGYVVEPPHTQQ